MVYGDFVLTLEMKVRISHMFKNLATIKGKASTTASLTE